MTSTLAALVRYALVGVVNAATYYAVYLVVLGEVGYLTAHVIGLGVAMVVSFFLNCRFTFRLRPTWRRFVLYPASQAVNIAATTIGVVALVTLGVDERIAPLAAAVLAVPASFLAARFVLARGQRRPAVDVVVDAAVDPDPATLRLTVPRRPVAGS
jgi:putative flippase GtrA